MPNFWNVVSNLPFLAAGLAGLRAFAGRAPKGALPELRPAYLSFFMGVLLVAFGSGWYHLNPSDASLFWDRLPMTTAFMAFAAILIGEHVDARAGRRALVFLIALGAASVGWWRQTGDLRPYLVVQFLPMLLAPLTMLLFASRFKRTGLVWGMFGFYALAKALEQEDRAVYGLLHGAMSGHALKHAAAAAGMYLFVVAVRTRPQAGTAR